MKVSSQVFSIAVLAGYAAANERGRQNDWHKAHKPNKFKPDAPRNEGKVLRTDREATRAVIRSFNISRLNLKQMIKLMNQKRQIHQKKLMNQKRQIHQKMQL